MWDRSILESAIRKEIDQSWSASCHLVISHIRPSSSPKKGTDASMYVQPKIGNKVVVL